MGGALRAELNEHTSFICWSRGTQGCDQLGRVLFVRADGTTVACTCRCHQPVERKEEVSRED